MRGERSAVARALCGLGLLVGVACTDVGRAGRDGTPAQGPAVPDRPHPRLDAAPIVEGWGAPADEPPGAAEFLFREGTIHTFALTLDAAAWRALSADPDTDVEATFRYGEDTWRVGVHLKGSFSFRGLSEKAAFKIDFGQYVPDQRFDGLRRLTLNNMVQDRSMIREHVAYQAYAWLGVPAPRHGYAELWVNDTLFGLYGVLETLDGTWVERAFPGDAEGPLYEGGYGVDLEDGDAYDFALQRQGDLVEPWTDLDALIAEVEAAPPDDILALIERRFHRTLFRMWAMDLVSGHRDGYVGRKNNFLLYHGLASDLWWMVPWGQDQSLRDGLDIHGAYGGRLARACARAPDCAARLDDAIGYVAEVWEAWDLYAYAAATGALVDEACARDPRRELPCGHEAVLEMIAERPDEVREMLGAAE